MITLENTIETIQIGKFTLRIYKRTDKTRFPKMDYAVLYEKATPRARHIKSKVVSHFVFESIQKAEAYISRISDQLNEIQKRKEEKREAQKLVKASSFYSVGDIIYDSWGYEQTNIDFYQVLRVLNKSIVVQRIKSQRVEGAEGNSGLSWDVVAFKNQFCESHKEITLRVKEKGQLTSRHGCMSKWDGKPKYTSCYY